MQALTLERDMRKFFFESLRRLTPPERIAYVKWCCLHSPGFSGQKAYVKSHTGEAHEAYNDVFLLNYQYGLDLEAAAVELEQRLRKPRGGVKWR